MTLYRITVEGTVPGFFGTRQLTQSFVEEHEDAKAAMDAFETMKATDANLPPEANVHISNIEVIE